MRMKEHASAGIKAEGERDHYVLGFDLGIVVLQLLNPHQKIAILTLPGDR